MRWFYYYPTFNKPSGGNKQLRLMASLLRELGVETFLVRDRRFQALGGFDDNVYYGVDVPVTPFPFEEAGDHLGADDVLLLPEVLLKSTLPECRGWKCRLALNNQNGFYALRYRPEGRWAGRTLEFALANAPYVASVTGTFLGVPAGRIFNVPHWIVRPPFDLRDQDGPRRLAVCYMPRKLPDEVRQVRERVQRAYPNVPWVEIDGLPEPEVARVYRDNSIFFAAQDLEGCPLTALEAMSCGCLVAGYAGTARFPHPYADAANGLWVPDRDVAAAAEAVGRAINVVRADPARHRRYLEAGRVTARRFDRQAVRAALVELLPVVAGRSYASRRHDLPRLDWRARLFAYRLLYDSDRLGWPGRVVSWLSAATRPLRRALRTARA
jgi:glycosyltransferase involved in cell wall biosynthesis